MGRLRPGGVCVGLVPALATGVCRAFDGPAVPAPHWTPASVVTGLLSTAAAVGGAAWAVRRGAPAEPCTWTAPLRRLHSGHVGDYVAWFVLGTAVLGAPALPGLLGSGL
ncbi:hypothetical protein [Streptomyces sp. NPDC050264]|uniref:hypothetical protein n=1 Tax=Streptomyces sp. NPDC050264 TaxID=3155038 RepID=UPI0034234887